MNKVGLLAIDQGTTSSRAMIFDLEGRCVAQAQQEFQQFYPQDGWVEHNPEEIWNTVLQVCRAALQQAEKQGVEVQGIGITNQRETTLLWDRQSGEPLYNAIVWQDRRTAEFCAGLRAGGHEEELMAQTGLLLDPYFSASKLRWILDHVDGARERAENGDLAFGTIDSFLLWRLSGGAVHATDATNASRTLLFNIHEQRWEPALLELFQIPPQLMPEVKDSAADFGYSEEELFGRAIPIGGIAGDQQAAAIGQGCLFPGMLKSTYGTGCFVLMNTGSKAVRSENRLLTTIAYRLRGEVSYAIEGSIFVAGAAVQWLRDGLKLIASASETEDLARGLGSNQGVYLVPAFTGLGAPYWDPQARGAIFGLTRDTGIAAIVRASLEAVAYQTRDLMTAMQSDSGVRIRSLRIDGGMTANDWLVQFLADILDLPVERPQVTETTALGVALLAGLQLGLYASLEELGAHWQREQLFTPGLQEAQRDALLRGWQKAVGRVLEIDTDAD